LDISSFSWGPGARDGYERATNGNSSQGLPECGRNFSSQFDHFRGADGGGSGGAGGGHCPGNSPWRLVSAGAIGRRWHDPRPLRPPRDGQPSVCGAHRTQRPGFRCHVDLLPRHPHRRHRVDVDLCPAVWPALFDRGSGPTGRLPGVATLAGIRPAECAQRSRSPGKPGPRNSATSPTALDSPFYAVSGCPEMGSRTAPNRFPSLPVYQNAPFFIWEGFSQIYERIFHRRGLPMGALRVKPQFTPSR